MGYDTHWVIGPCPLTSGGFRLPSELALYPIVKVCYIDTVIPIDPWQQIPATDWMSRYVDVVHGPFDLFAALNGLTIWIHFSKTWVEKDVRLRSRNVNSDRCPEIET
ncbi:hypothetical protein OUZ56_014991 [Daphnia magna]|uniref:Uncharacterized protein n=1 Tax=Daphnia magna TaxID=35525 RepID=A0ABR0ALP2_9CRUS|nr:hypothetical protein OUZ56_014991 [Daphnia magna]